jgi:hypothetical protein
LEKVERGDFGWKREQDVEIQTKSICFRFRQFPFRVKADEALLFVLATGRMRL